MAAPGKFDIPAQWLRLSTTLAASCSEATCTDRYGFAAASDHPLFVHSMCVAAHASSSRHVSVRTVSPGGDAASQQPILFAQQHVDPGHHSSKSQIQEWNSHAFGVRAQC